MTIVCQLYVYNLHDEKTSEMDYSETSLTRPILADPEKKNPGKFVGSSKVT